MRSKLSLLITICIMLSCFTGGCANEKITNYEVLVADFSDGLYTDGLEIKDEYDFVDEEQYQDYQPPEYMEVKLGNRTFSGTFYECDYSSLNCFPTYDYKDAQGNFFSVDQDGQLRSFTMFKENLPPIEENIGQEACVAIAKELLEDFADVSEYRMEIKEVSDWAFYEITFWKYINGIRTADSVSVDVYFDGQIRALQTSMFNCVHDTTKTRDIDLVAVVEAIHAKLDTFAPEVGLVWGDLVLEKIEYGEPNIKLTILKDGSRGLDCYIDVNYIFDHMVFGQKYHLVIPLP